MAGEPTLPSNEELIAFLEDLRVEGWKIDLQRIVDAGRLLDRARHQRVWAERFVTRLAPLIATNPVEQHEFEARWRARFDTSIARRAREAASVRLTVGEKPPVRPPWYARSVVALAAFGATALIVGLAVYVTAPPVFPLPVPMPKLEGDPPSLGSCVTSPDLSPTYPCELAPVFVPERTVDEIVDDVHPATTAMQRIATIAPILLTLAWLGWRWWHRVVWLLPGMASPRSRLTELKLPTEVTDSLFTSPRFRRAAQDLRKHQPVLTSEVDVERSVAATIDAGGLFTSIRREAPRLPEHLFLIERRTSNDHLARLFEVALRRLRDEGVSIDAYHYQHDPRLAYPMRPGAAPLDLRDLTALSETQRLIVLGTADGFFHPISGKVESWVRDFQPWTSLTLMSTKPLSEWTDRELQLLDEGFSLATATSKGLDRVTDKMAHGEPELPELLEGRIVLS